MILGILFLTIYARTVFPLAGLVTEGILVFDIFIFLLILIVSLNFKNFFKFNLAGANKILVLLLCIAVISFSYSYIYNLKYNLNLPAISKTLSYFIVTIIFVFILSKKMYEDDVFFEFILSGLLIFGTISSVFAVAMYALGIHPIPEYSNSTTGIFAHPNTASLAYTILTPIVLYKYFSKKISLPTFVVIILLFAFCLLFTFSRAGYLGVFFGMLIFTYNKSKKIFIITAIVLLLIVSSLFLEFALAKNDSSLGRSLLLLTAINMITADQSSFLWGYGVFNSVEVFQTEKIFLGSVENVVDPHNLILLLGIQFGMIFTFSVLAIISIVIIKNFFALSKKTTFENKNKVNLCLAVTLGLLLQNMLEDLIFYPEYFVMPLFLIFFGYLYYNIKPTNKNKNVPKLNNLNN